MVSYEVSYVSLIDACHQLWRAMRCLMWVWLMLVTSYGELWGVLCEFDWCLSPVMASYEVSYVSLIDACHQLWRAMRCLMWVCLMLVTSYGELWGVLCEFDWCLSPVMASYEVSYVSLIDACHQLWRAMRCLMWVWLMLVTSYGELWGVLCEFDWCLSPVMASYEVSYVSLMLVTSYGELWGVLCEFVWCLTSAFAVWYIILCYIKPSITSNETLS